MGSGKSYFGKTISEKNNLPFIDLDNFIEDKECQSVLDIFKTKGEDYFRQLEYNAIKEILLLKKKYIISLGGGTPCFFNTMHLIKENGFVIYLKNDFETLLHRIKDEFLLRPLLQKYLSDNNTQKLQQLFEERNQIYQQAHQTLTSTFSNFENLNQLILKKYYEQ